MAFDFKKEYREYYLPPQTPVIVNVPPINYVGAYDMEPLTIDKIKALVAQEGLSIDINENRFHHEIYLSDPRKTAADKLKTVIRYPVK